MTTLCGIADRLDISGARWGLEGAKAVLRLRALHSNGDFDATGAITSPANTNAPTNLRSSVHSLTPPTVGVASTPTTGPTELAIAGADRRSMTVCGGPTSWPYPQADGGGATSERHAAICDLPGPSGQYRGAR